MLDVGFLMLNEVSGKIIVPGNKFQELFNVG